ncbi:MAG: hypothetical protein EA407_02335 [Rhodobacteraceae bacterium]|nr:MAG: hypothetical protein EA407_02335 [Paracoccaceae bacterium]
MDHLTRDLIESVLSGDYICALRICRDALARPEIGPERIHQIVILPTIRAVGQAWADDSASFEQASLAHILLHRLLEYVARSNGAATGMRQAWPVHDARVMVTVAPGDTHDFGAQILSQHLRLSGWPVTFFGHRQRERVVPTLAQQRYSALAISVSCDENLAGLADFVMTSRMASTSPKLHLMIGGAAIQPPFDQYDFLGADRVGLAIDEVASYLSNMTPAIPADRWN